MMAWQAAIARNRRGYGAWPPGGDSPQPTRLDQSGPEARRVPATEGAVDSGGLASMDKRGG